MFGHDLKNIIDGEGLEPRVWKLFEELFALDEERDGTPKMAEKMADIVEALGHPGAACEIRASKHDLGRVERILDQVNRAAGIG